MKVAVVDVGTNSTRLLVADVAGGKVAEIDRRTRVTRLGEGVDAEGRLAESAMERVFAACHEFREAIDAHGDVERVIAILTSAVRDAANGPDFERELARRFGFEAQTVSGEREAYLTYAGATSARAHDASTMVLDIGGGSTEIVVGQRQEVEFFVSTQVGSVRFTERHLLHDPPTAAELTACRRAVRAELEAAVPLPIRTKVRGGIAVAGTPTSFAAIDLALEPYDPARVEGHRLTRAACERILADLAEMPLAERRRVPGLHPDRAPTIVAGGVILLAGMFLCRLEQIEVSERDILHGAALAASDIG